MQIVFRVDASNLIGIGHMSRCITLAKLLRKKGAGIQFISRAYDGHLGELLKENKFNTKLLSAPRLLNKKKYINWFGISQKEDSKDTLEIFKEKKPDWLIVDHYGLDYQWEIFLQSYVGNIMVIDDMLNRKHFCNLFLNQNYTDKTNKDYQNLLPENCKILLGPKYALLNSEYVKLRKTFSRTSDGQISSVLLSLGGSDNENITSFVIDALNDKEFSQLKLDVVIGINNRNRENIMFQASKRPNTFVHEQLISIASLMVNADLCIGGGGSSTWERICLALPSLVFCVSENQKPTCELLSKDGFIELAGPATNLNKIDLRKKLTQILKNSQSVFSRALKAQRYVDGFGTNRVVDQIFEIFNGKH